MTTEELAAMVARDAEWRPRCAWTFIAADGRPVECGAIESQTYQHDDHTFIPTPGEKADRRALLALLRKARLVIAEGQDRHNLLATLEGLGALLASRRRRVA
jgi:hypothetical protein